MNVRRNMEVAGATVLSALALLGPAAVAHGSNPNKNPTNQLAREYTKEIGGRVLEMAANSSFADDIVAESVSQSVSVPGAAKLTLTLDAGQSNVTGSSGEYNFSVFADRVGANGFDVGDINSVRVAEGSDPANPVRPLFALRLAANHPHAAGPNEGGDRGWYGAEGTAVLGSGDAVFFSGGINPNRHDTPPALLLDSSEITAAGDTMKGILQAAADGDPTQLIAPPFTPLQRIN